MADVLEKAEPFYKSYRELGGRSRQRRVEDIAKGILGACVDRRELRDDGLEYMVENKLLAIDVLNCLDQVRTLLQRKLCVDFSKIAHVPTPIGNENDAPPSPCSDIDE